MQTASEIAIVGYACRMPGASDVDRFWHLLENNRCSVTSITPDRFPTRPYFHPSSGQIGRSYTFAAGVIDDVWGFDATAFGMSPREAEQVDPQHRHLLEVTCDALAHAGLRPSSLSGSETGVYVGASSVDYATRFIVDPAVADVHMMTGNSVSIMANRISYTLNLRGPSIAFDTACSSSLVALHLASEAIRSGAIDTAIVGGVNLLLSPFSYVGFSQASMLSPTGLCRPFDAAADGYVRSEGVVIVVLRSMAAAHRARNRIHGVLVGSGINQDGRTTGLSLPSPESQQALLEQVYGKYAVDPADLLFVEAHGTGTRVGDPIEAHALGKGLGQKRAQPLPIGSVKSNVGHLEPVSGLAGLLKTVLALDNELVPATLHQKSPSPDIPFDELNLRVVGRNWRLPERRAPALAGVNSFGFGGTNAHAIVRSDAANARLVYWRNTVPPPPLLLTAHTAEALPRVAAAYDASWPSEPRAASSFVGASAHLRDPLPHRLLLRGGSVEEIRLHLRAFASTGKAGGALGGVAIGNDLPVGFLFSGNGAQWVGMGREAWQASVQFREALRDVDEHFRKVQDWSIVDQLFHDDLETMLRQASRSQPLLLALQIATVRALEDAGVVPVATVGHSVGEIAAAWAAGALSLEQAIAVVNARSRHQEIVRHAGGMAALMLSEREARRFLAGVPGGSVEIAAINSWRSVTVSGTNGDIEAVLAEAGRNRISARRLDLDYPFHSALIDPVRAPLLQALDGLRPLVPRGRMISSVTGEPVDSAALDAEYWWRNVREPVRFDAALNRMIEDGVRVFVEVGPRPILSSYVRDILREAGARGVLVETLTEQARADGGDPVEHSVARILLAGGRVDLVRFFGPPPAIAVPQPPYPWQHTPFAVPASPESGTALIAPVHPLLGRRPRLDCTEWFSTVDPPLFPWLEDHRVAKTCLFPATGFAEVMLEAAQEWLGDGPLELRDVDIVRPLAFEGKSAFETLVRLAPDTGIVDFLSRPRDGLADWTLHARGIVARAPEAVGRGTPPAVPPGTAVVAKPRVYARARSLGFDYGPSFQRIRQVAFPHPKVAVAPLEPLSATLDGPHVVDLTAFDATFHALFASEEAGVADMPMRPMVPVRFRRIRVWRPGSVAVLATARTVRQSPTSLVADIDLYAADGVLAMRAEGVRLINLPAAAGADPLALGYRMTAWQLDRPGETSPLACAEPLADDAPEGGAAVAEGVLLLEAACLRMAWEAVASTAPPTAPDLAEGTPNAEPPVLARLLRAALLLHLEAHGLAVEAGGERRPAAACGLPDVAAIVRSLAERHPTMVGEAAGVARLPDVLPRLLEAAEGAEALLASAHWRGLAAGACQPGLLRDAVTAELTAVLQASDRRRLLRLVMVGADHVAAACDLVDRFANLEVVVTDPDVDRVEQARLSLADDFPRIRCEAWSALAEAPAAFADALVAIDGLSEAAARGDGLAALLRLLRPGAPLIAGELAPGLFWDLVRCVRPGWWARSANPDVPVSPLLTAEEWRDELALAGLEEIIARPLVGEHPVGVLLRARQPAATAAGMPAVAGPVVVSWEGDAASPALRAALDEAAGAVAGPAEAPVTDVIWTVDGSTPATEAVDSLVGHLAGLAERCRRLAEAPARLWVVVDFGARADVASPLDEPLWTALAAALRVARNEHPGLLVAGLGLHDAEGSGAAARATARAAAAEILAPGPEGEVFLAGGRRLVFRAQRGPTEPQLAALPADRRLGLADRPGTARGGLAWAEADRPLPGPGQVEIEVAAASLNFRDVMWNLGLLPEEALEDGFAGATLGMECAGTVARVGPGVGGFRPGQPVVAFASGAFASHVTVPAFAVSVRPDGLGAEAASTLPVAFLTAHYGLVHLGRLAAGETVLIHGGAGAVGLAAIQIARRRGARIAATAGSEEKRAFLRACGVDLVASSRSLSFADEVMAWTGGQGVDVVLNSLAGEAMVRSLDCVRPFGRFVELGKRDFYANTHVGLRPLRRNLSYFGVDVDQLIGDHAELARRLFGEVMAGFARGELHPLPHRVFAAGQAGEAFRVMQRSGHVGKIVVRPPRRAPEPRTVVGRFPVDGEGVHVVVGGTRGFGLATARWLAGRGARHLVLASRSGAVGEGDAAGLAALRETGAEVTLAALDVTDGAALRRLLRDLEATRPVRGIVHAAMVLDDRLMETVDAASLGTVLGPKVTGARQLAAAAADLRLDYLLLFSSATTLFGNPGQYGYVAANGFLDGLARRLRARGVPALAIAWGGIEDAGFLARNIGADATLKRRFAASLVAAETALDGLDWAFNGAGRQIAAGYAVARIDWSMARRELAATRAPTFDSVGGRQGARQSGDATALLEKLRALPREEVAEALLDIVVEEIARVLRLPAKEVDRHRPLAEIGMDSLMMLELRTTVEDTLQIELPMMSLSSGITPADVARKVAPLVTGEKEQIAVPSTLVSLSASHFAAEAEGTSADERQAAVSAVLERARKLEGPL